MMSAGNSRLRRNDGGERMAIQMAIQTERTLHETGHPPGWEKNRPGGDGSAARRDGRRRITAG